MKFANHLPRQIQLPFSPEEVAERLRHVEGLIFLDSADPSITPQGKALSIITAAPSKILTGSLFDENDLTETLSQYRLSECVDFGMPQGGAFGFVDYDGSYVFGIYQNILIFDHELQQWFEVGDLCQYLCEKPKEEMLPNFDYGPFCQEMQSDAFCDAVRKAQEYIAAGDIYQVNLSQRFSLPWEHRKDAFSFYRALRASSPSPQAAYVRLGGYEILCASPESFLKMSGRSVQTRPIKGTRPRFLDPKMDERSAMELMTSPKEIAELVMITDLERNDLGQFCEYGSVEVSELLKMERFEQVFHLVSTVNGTLTSETTHLDALTKCFPGGSITGAPKKRAREIIAELEPCPRGIYTGSIGYLGFNEESQFNIAIRTVVIEEGRLHFHVGAGIVADSEPEKEYEETLHKAAGIFAGWEHLRKTK